MFVFVPTLSHHTRLRLELHSPAGFKPQEHSRQAAHCEQEIQILTPWQGIEDEIWIADW